MSDLEIPSFLRGPRPGPQPRWNLPWRRCAKAVPPEGQVWENAERWEVSVGKEVPVLACGLRRLWVVEGRKWCRLSDGEAKVKVSMSMWRQLQRHAKLL